MLAIFVLTGKRKHILNPLRWGFKSSSKEEKIKKILSNFVTKHITKSSQFLKGIVL